MFKNLQQAGRAAVLGLATSVFGTAVAAQNSLNDLPFVPDSVVNILAQRGISFDSLIFTAPQPRDSYGPDDCFDANRDGVADTHPSGRPIRGDDNLYTFIIVRGNEADDVSGVHGVSREVAFGLLQQERNATGILFSPEGGGRIISVYSNNNGNITVARHGAINPVTQPSSAVSCGSVRVRPHN